MSSFLLVLVVLIVTFNRLPVGASTAGGVQLEENSAKSFIRRARWFRTDIRHECYSEGCDWEEVEEVYGETEKGYEFWYDYRCLKFGQNCKVLCSYRKDCSFGEWGSWNNIRHGNQLGCYKSTRSKPYKHELQQVWRRHGCDGLNTHCRTQPQEMETFCKCPRVTCFEGDWGEWDRVPEDTCLTQTRWRQMRVINHVAERTGNCDGVQTVCPKPKESRRRCNCSYREDCTVLQWEAWKGDIPDVGCGVQIRTRQYNNSIIYVDRNSCDELESCPVLKEETRIKCNCFEVVCKWSAWFTESSDHQTGCTIEARVQNISSGFQKVERDHTCAGVRTSCRKEPRIERHKTCTAAVEGVDLITTEEPLTQPVIPKTTTSSHAKFVGLGCFKDSGHPPRPLPKLIKNLRSSINWMNLHKTVQECADIAREKRMEYFSVQFWGECWSGVNAGKTYADDGKADDGQCYEGVGRGYANFVYRLTNKQECSDELHGYKLLSSEGKAASRWCLDVAEKWLKVDLVKVRRITGMWTCTGIGTKGTSIDSWLELYTITFSKDGKKFVPYEQDKDTPKVFAGNAERYTVEVHWLENPFEARYLVFHPRQWITSNVCLTIHLFGC